MRPLRTLSSRTTVLVDQQGFLLAAPDGSVVGSQPPLPGERLVHALQLNTQSGLTRRYEPSHPVGESATFGMDFSEVIPVGVGIAQGSLQIFRNVVPPVLSFDWALGAVTVRGRALYATLGGGVDGTDYRLTWTATDTDGNVWPRTALCLCAATS